MSKLRSDYESSRWYKFVSWVNGTAQEENNEEEFTSSKTVVQPSGGRKEEKPELAQRVEVQTLNEQEWQEQKENQMDSEHPFQKRWLHLFHRVYKIMSVLICMSIIGVLLYTVSYLPRFGNPENPDNNEVSARYIEKGLEETGAVNIVTGMILDYRAFDTFGESNVLYIAACTVMILLRLDKGKSNKSTKAKNDAEEDDRKYEPKNDVILQRIATMLVPPIVMFGIYVILNGHLSPGGGFSGGAIVGAGLILYLNAFGFKKTERFFTMKTFQAITFASLSFYALSKSYSFYTGANHIPSGIPLGIPGHILSSGLILPLNICVGCVVACTMYGFYALFRKGGM